MIRAYDDYGNVVDLVAWEKQIRADVIEEISNALYELDTFCDNDHWTSDGSVMWKTHEVMQILEQLKEQTDE